MHGFRDWLRSFYGLEATGLRIPYTPESRNLRADLFVANPRVLIEAKSSAARESLRLALGQLLDYRRWIDPPPRLAVLIPSPAPSDMVVLLKEFQVGAAWPVGSSFEVIPPELFIGE